MLLILDFLHLCLKKSKWYACKLWFSLALKIKYYKVNIQPFPENTAGAVVKCTAQGVVIGSVDQIAPSTF